jgi:hypothetical protein
MDDVMNRPDDEQMPRRLAAQDDRSIIEIVDVRTEADRLLHGAALDAPTPGAQYDAYAVAIRGWARGRESRAVALEVHVGGRAGLRQWRVPMTDEGHAPSDGANEAGTRTFQVEVNALRLPRQFVLNVFLVLENDERVPMARIEGRRKPVASSFEPSVHPLMVTTLGRSGSTILVDVLNAHHAIAAYKPLTREPRAGTYWMDVLCALSDPAGYMQQVFPPPQLGPTWWLGGDQPVPPTWADSDLQGWLGREYIERLAAICQSQLNAVYEQMALQGGKSAVYFAEKFAPGSVTDLLWDLYPDAREVVLVRDFRDVVCSIIAFEKKRGHVGFGHRGGPAPLAQITHMVRSSALALLRSLRSRTPDVYLLRYEDLILSPRDTVAALLDYLHLDRGDSAIDDMLARLTKKLPKWEAHRTTTNASASVGRWEHDLDAESREHCNEALGPMLEAFGYETVPPVDASPNG